MLGNRRVRLAAIRTPGFGREAWLSGRAAGYADVDGRGGGDWFGGVPRADAAVAGYAHHGRRTRRVPNHGRNRRYAVHPGNGRAAHVVAGTCATCRARSGLRGGGLRDPHRPRAIGTCSAWIPACRAHLVVARNSLDTALRTAAANHRLLGWYAPDPGNSMVVRPARDICTAVRARWRHRPVVGRRRCRAGLFATGLRLIEVALMPLSFLG